MIGVVATRTMLQVHQSETCSVAACAEIVGAKWTVLIVHELSEGARRFTQIEHSCAGISPRTLAERLRWLEAEEIVDPPQLRRVAAARRVRADREGRGAAAPHRRDAPLRPRLARLRRPRPLAAAPAAMSVADRARSERLSRCSRARVSTLSGLLAPDAHELHDRRRRRGHVLHARPLAPRVVLLPAGEEVRRRQPHRGQARAVGAAADDRAHRLDARAANRLLGGRDDLAGARRSRLACSGTDPSVSTVTRARGSRSSISAASRWTSVGVLARAARRRGRARSASRPPPRPTPTIARRMDEPLAPLGRLGREGVARQRGDEVGRELDRVHELALRRARMLAAPLDLTPSAGAPRTSRSRARRFPSRRACRRPRRRTPRCRSGRRRARPPRRP